MKYVIQVAGPDDRYYNLDCVQREGATASTSIALGESGSYEVAWQVVSSDAHLISDTFDFAYKMPADEADKSVRTADEAPKVTVILGGGGIVDVPVVAAMTVAVMGLRNRRSLDPDSNQQPKMTHQQRDRYGRPTFRRTALAPGLPAGIVALAGVALVESDSFLIIRYVIAIMAFTIAWFTLQAPHRWWPPALLAIPVVWNPVFSLGLSGLWWIAAQYVAALCFIFIGIFVKDPNPGDSEAEHRAGRY